MRTKTQEMEFSSLEDMTASIGAPDNTLIHSLINKIVRIKSGCYQSPVVLFEDRVDCYRVSLIWKEQVAFNYIDDINPLVELATNRIKDFNFSPSLKDEIVHTILSFDLIKEAQVDAVPCLTKRKRGDRLQRLPSINTIVYSSDDFKKRRTKINGAK